MMSEQKRALRVPAGDREDLVDGAGGLQTVGGEERFDVASGLVDR